MRKLMIAALGVTLSCALAGCGGSSDYRIFETQRGPAQTTYRVRVETGMTMSRAQEIAKELKGDESKTVMVNFYDGERSVENMIYTCTDGECYDAQPSR